MGTVEVIKIDGNQEKNKIDPYKISPASIGEGCRFNCLLCLCWETVASSRRSFILHQWW